MRLTRAGEYAVRCALYLARKPLGQVVSRQEVASGGNIPPLFLAKIAQDLARAGIIEIRQGAKGGFRLLVPPAELTLLAVIEAIIGEIFLNDCVMQPASCAASASCAINRVWIKARNQLRDTLREVTFTQLLADESCCILTGDRPCPVAPQAPATPEAPSRRPPADPA
ncbi:MAG: Rrf2 family transcriptional regulator [Thermodesulfobacteriota bacterium]